MQNNTNKDLKSISKEALETINSFEYLPLPKKIKCPYYNNKREKLRAGLRPLIGKGSPQEIADEAEIVSLREKFDIKNASEESLKKFLVDKNMGIDCSGFVYYVLDSESNSKGLGSIRKYIQFPKKWTFIRRLIAKLRPIENTSVTVFSDNHNSKVVNLKEIRPGDFISITHNKDEDKINDHIIIIKSVFYEDNVPISIEYVHSMAWPTDGVFDHGISQGKISVNNIDSPVQDQIWEEKGTTGDVNFTQKRAKLSNNVEIRRLKIF